MSQYPLTKKYLPELELKKLFFDSVHTVDLCLKASDLEQALQKAYVVYGQIDSRPYNVSCVNDTRSDTHQGLLLGYQPIEKPLEPASKEELVDLMDKMEKHINIIGLEMTPLYNSLRERIKKAGVK